MPQIADHFKPLAAELEIAVKGKDSELAEGYRLYSKKQLRAFSDFVNKLLDDCKLFAGNEKKSRAPRKRKAKSADQVVKRVRYQRADTDLKIVSIDPTNIVGASELWLFNTKYRVLYHYVAIDRGGLSVKGTTLINYDEKASQRKKLRKPEDILPNIVQGGPKAAVKLFDSLKTKPAEVNGRINEFTVILRGLK
jgi:hypothetical protein